MRDNSKWDRVFSTASWIVVIALFVSAISLWISEPSGAGPIAKTAGVLGAQIFYSALYGIEAGFLAFSKWKKRNKMRKNALLVIYLTGFFTTLLTLSIVGWTPALADNLIISVASAACWLHWTFKTEYVDYKDL